jgi:hypothetical protein
MEMSKMAKASDLLKIAIAELGYCEKETNSQLDNKTANAGNKNWTKYARDLHKAGYYQANKNGYAWCDMFVDWCCLKVTGSKEKGEYLQCQSGPYGAGCACSSEYFRKAGRFGTTPEIGSQIFFGKKGKESHTGLVERFDNTYVYTIEGNAGNKVTRKTYKRNDQNIVGYGYMRFDKEELKSIEDIAKEVIAGKWDNGEARKQKLETAGYNYEAVQKVVNKLSTNKTETSKKSNIQVAREVLKGLWGNGSERKKRLEKAGYDYKTIQKLVNKLVR